MDTEAIDGAICSKESEEVLSSVTRAGLLSLIEYAKLCNPDRLSLFKGHLPTNDNAITSLKNHRSCQKTASNNLRKRKAAISNETAAKKSKKRTRFSVPEFDWKKQCFFCSKPCSDAASDPKHPD